MNILISLKLVLQMTYRNKYELTIDLSLIKRDMKI